MGSLWIAVKKAYQGIEQTLRPMKMKFNFNGAAKNPVNTYDVSMP